MDRYQALSGPNSRQLWSRWPGGHLGQERHLSGACWDVGKAPVRCMLGCVEGTCQVHAGMCRRHLSGACWDVVKAPVRCMLGCVEGTCQVHAGMCRRHLSVLKKIGLVVF
ncbi:hypothetical protein Bbelb_260590 [Branchiostoma belcheri]|nr:hypothetical protein Bbelb_260590 [Branchiostoma belcheri]